MSSTVRGNFFLMFIYFERERERAGDKQREGEIEYPSSLLTVSTEPGVGLDLMNPEIMTRVEIKSWTLNQLSHLGAPEW